MTDQTTATPTWLDDVTARLGPASVAYPDGVTLRDRLRRCWVWFPDGVNHNVAIDRYAPTRWEASAGGSLGSARWVGRAEPTDSQMHALCVLAGLLADPGTLPGPHVLAVDAGGWTIHHPIACTVPTPTGPALICLVDELARAELAPAGLPAGRYDIWSADEPDHAGGHLRIGDRLADDAPLPAGARTASTCRCEDPEGRRWDHPYGTGQVCGGTDLCPDPWHSSPTEPTEPCPACEDPALGQLATGDGHTSSTIAASNRFARAAGGQPDDGRDWVRLRTGSGRQYEGHRSPTCPGDDVAGHQHDIRCVDQAEG